jgi:hypothetical protein
MNNSFLLQNFRLPDTIYLYLYIVALRGSALLSLSLIHLLHCGAEAGGLAEKNT